MGGEIEGMCTDDECGSEIVELRCRLGVELDMWSAWVTNMGRKAIEGDIVIAGAWILDIGLKTVDGDKVLAGSDAADEVCNAIGGGNVFAGTHVVDVSCKAMGEGGDAIDKGCNVDEGHDAIAEVCESIGGEAFAGPCVIKVDRKVIDGGGIKGVVLANKHGDGVGCRSRVVGSWWRLGVGLEMICRGPMVRAAKVLT